ncbi:MAG: DNA replication/repair protein RecF, partial [Eubacteriaceae bacterium]
YNENIRIEITNLNKLNIYINKKKINKKDSLTKKIHIILFSPEDLKLIKEGPDNRRKFIDNELGIIKPFYGKILKDYNKVLYQRNNLLKSLKFRKTTNNSLEIWNEQLINLGKKIIIYRINFLQKINKITNVIHNSLSNNQENLKLYYISNIIKSNDDLENIEETYKNLIEKNVKYDLEKGYTSIGPHLDDIKVVINNFDAKIYGSQGQQRTAALSMKLSEIELIKSELKEYPIILLDDVMSELDINRQKKVIKYFDNMQVVFTCTELNFENFIQNYDKKIYTIHQGKIKNIK